MKPQDYGKLVSHRTVRAQIIAKAGSINKAIAEGLLKDTAEVTLSEAVVMGLLRQGVRIFLSVLGHGSTEIGEVLRIYQEAGVVRTCGVRNEIEAAHAATALRWVTGEKAATTC